MDEIRFSLTEFLSLIGVVQCVFILVFIAFRSRSLRNTVVPAVFFLCLGFLFLSDFSSAYIGVFFPPYRAMVLWLWFTTLSLSILVIMQISADRQVVDNLWRYILPILPLCALFFAITLSRMIESCNTGIWLCDGFYNWFILGGILSGSIALLSLWLDKDMFTDIRKQKFGQEKYWLILTIIISNIASIFLMFLSLQTDRPDSDIVHIRIFLGLAFVYLVTTSLFRLYPYLSEMPDNDNADTVLNHEDTKLAEKIDSLFKLDKVYQEAGFNRATLARELGVAEVVVSRVINVHFGKSLPQLLNEYRIEDAKALLVQTDMQIAAIAQEAGFNSLATFNRAFRDYTGRSPRAYRQDICKD